MTNEYSYLQLFRDIWWLICPYRLKFFAGVFFRFTSDIAQLYPIWAFSRLIQLFSDTLIQYNRIGESVRGEVLLLLIGWVLYVLYHGLMHNYCKYLGNQVAENAALDLGKKCFQKLLELDYSWQEKENSGNKMKRIDQGTEGINRLIRILFGVLIESFVNIVGIILILATADWRISLALIFFTLTYYTIGTVLVRAAIAQQKLVSTKLEDAAGLTFESLNNIRTIKSLGLNEGILKMISFQIEALREEIRKRIFRFQFRNGLLNSYEMVFEFLMICLILWGVLNGQFEVSLLVLFKGLFQRVTESTREVTEVTQEIVISKIGISRAMEILQTESTVENPVRVLSQDDYPKNWQNLSIRNLTFKYHNHEVLKDISFDVKRGEKVGIVGLSGAGKSTLFKLLLNLYEGYVGDIFLDDVSLKEIKRQSFIDHVAVVLQDTELFNMSLQENILLAGVDGQIFDQKEFEQVLEMSNLKEVIKKLPEGVDTLVGEKGVKLSGGQRQRVGIARALYREPDILLFDEATSHLDVHSEQHIQKFLHTHFEFTTIVIAHRLSTVKEMDKIVVLDKGRVAEVGSFDELSTKKNGIFTKMWRAQKL